MLSRASRQKLRVAGWCWISALGAANAQNQPPQPPVITEPAQDGPWLNPADVHMETQPFADPNPGDEHLSTDWEIWTIAPSERIWSAASALGLERLHVHLGDGAFEGSHLGRSELAGTTDFLLRARHSDDSGDPSTRWSGWSDRAFRTGTTSQVYPLELRDVAVTPPPRWVRESDGADVILSPVGISSSLSLDTVGGGHLLTFYADDGARNTIIDSPPLPDHGFVRLRLAAGSLGLSLPATDLRIADEHCGVHRIILPAVDLPPGGSRLFWIASTGASYFGEPWQGEPVFSAIARGLSPPWSVHRAGFAVEVFADGFQLPVNMAFVPGAGPNADDPFLYVTELYGTIRVVTRDGTTGTYAANLLDFDPSGNFPGSGEQGLTGIAVEPGTRDVYACMLYASAADPSQHFPKIVRFQSQDGGRTAATATTVLDMAGETQGQSHQVSNLTITPDGKLLCHMGDGFVAARAQDLESFRGKILRLNLDGSPPHDNPFYDSGDGIGARDYVYAYGLRNPFGGDWRAADGRHYEVENGPNVDRFAQILPGRNFGWDGSEVSMTIFAIHTWAPAHAPVNLAFVQPETFGGSGFPPSLMGHAFVTESGPTYARGPQARGKRITEWILDAGGKLAEGPLPFLEYAGDGWATACGLEAGPDGLYMTELYADHGSAATDAGARIVRIRFDPAVDCNGNGADDECDIASGASADRNSNSIPDECETSVVPFCAGDGSSIPCPCGNTGTAGRGCENSIGTGGALLGGSGSARLSADTLVLRASGERATALTLFWQGDVERPAVVFGDGIGCQGGNQIRLYIEAAAGGVVQVPEGSEPPVSVRSAALGDTIAAGTTRVYHAFYRDPDPGFCPPPLGSTFNTTNGLRILWSQ